MNIKKSVLVFASFLFAVMAAAVAPALAESKTPAAVLREIGSIPVQQGGRVKPFRSFAEEAVLYVTGRSHFQGMDAVDLAWQWISLPEKWSGRPLIPVTHPALREELGIMLVKHRLAPEVALQNQEFVEKVQAAAAKKQRKDMLTTVEKKRIEIYERALFFKGLAEGASPGWVAHPDDPRASWLPLQSLLAADGQQILKQFFTPAVSERVARAFTEAFQAVRENDGAGLLTLEQAQNLSSSLAKLFESREIALDRTILSSEMTYLTFRPFHQAWRLYLLSFLLGLAVLALSVRGGWLLRSLEVSGLAVYLAAFGIHAYGFYLRCVVAGRPPVTNMYESMIWVSWAVALFALVLYVFYRTLFIRNTAALVAGVALLLAESFPVALNPAISPLVPVLRSNLWLTVHVLTITLSYGAFLLAWGLGHGVVYVFAFAPSDADRQRMLSQYLYRAVQIGVVLLAAGTVLGGVWANYSWGRFWGWDPKETWALIALLGYLVVLHARYAGWAGNFGIALGSCIAFLGVLMAWYGVNFVLGAGLHSYGFSGGGLSYVMAAIAVDLAVLGAMTWRYRQGFQKKSFAESRI